MALIEVNVSGLQGLADKLKTVGTTASTKFYDGLAEAGEIVAVEARKRAGYSTDVPGSIHTDVIGPGLVRVGSSMKKAAAFENRGKGRPRHPLFGNKTHWYGGKGTQSFTPPAFLHPALDATEDGVREKVITTVYEAFEEAGL